MWNINLRSIEFEVLKLKKVLDECNINFYSSYKKKLEVDIYILIKKEFIDRTSTNASREVNEKELKIFYKKLCEVDNVFLKNKYINLFPNSSYNNMYWSAIFREEYNEVEFAPVPYEVDYELRDRGLGSYLIDSLLIWVKENFSTATVRISIKGYTPNADKYACVDEGKQNEKRVSHFYEKRKIKNRSKVKDKITYLEDENSKIERIMSYEELLESLSKDVNKKILVLDR